MDKNKHQNVSSGLYLVSTPIGNMEDITFRALNILKKSDIILCEDTRRSGKLLLHFKIKSKLISYHKFNEKKISDFIIDSLKGNKIISLISDAGTPTISDPGLVLVNKCIDKNLDIYPIPGPSAVTAAISSSGFSDKYLFYGFLTKKEKELNNVLKKLVDTNYSIVFFIPGSKINFYIEKFKVFFSDRNILIAKEMTKMHEKFIRGKISSIKSIPLNTKGEFTIVISEKIIKNNIKEKIDDSIKVEIKKMLKKYSHKDVVDFISKKENLPKKIVYNFCLNLKKQI
jgi:16S rRNA (cytidine1402-2'-O)-methyltransferase